MTRAISEATAEDLVSWVVYADMEPFGPLKDSQRAGVVAAAALAPWSPKGQGPKPRDLFPELRGRKRQMTDEEMILGFQAWAATCPISE